MSGTTFSAQSRNISSAFAFIERRDSADESDVRDWLYPYYCGAGRGASDKFGKAATRWRKRVLSGLRLVFAAIALLLIIALHVWDFSFSSWAFGLALGALLAIYMAVRESPPPYIENWRTGAEGERRTAKALAPLRRDGYVLFHDLPDRRARDHSLNGNMNHIVVSTAGVFLLDTKYLGGEVSIAGDAVHVQMLDDDEQSYESRHLASTMRRRAVRLKEDIKGTGITWVQPVVVFWSPFAAGLAEEDGVVYLHGDRLVGWLEQQPAKLAPEMVARISTAIAQGRPRENQPWWERAAQRATRRGVPLRA